MIVKLLQKIKITHYRGYFDEQIIEFAQPSGKHGSGLTLIVGPNNTGKTTIIESLLLSAEKKFKHSDRHETAIPNIDIISTSGSCNYSNIDRGSQIKTSGNHGLDFEVIQSRRFWQDYSQQTYNTDQFAQQSKKHDLRNSSGVDTAGVLKSINRSNKEKFNTYMKKLIPHFSDWTIDTNERGDYVKYGISGREHQSSFLGDGIISLFRICAHLLNESPNRVFIIDEPELSLHPSAQKSLSKLLSEIAKNKQIILCTHSPYFSNWEDFVNGAKFIRLNKLNDIQCEVSSLKNDKNYATFIENNLLDWQKPQLLDVAAKEVLFSERILFVEGQEDVGLIRKWLNENNKNQNFDIFGYGVSGYSNMKLFLEMAKDLNLHKVAALYDSGPDANRSYAEDSANYPQFFFKKLSTSDIRDKPSDLGSKIGIFDKSGNIKDEHKISFEEIMDAIINYFN